MMWTLEKQSICVLEAVHIEIQTIKHEVLSVSKSFAWFQLYVHIRACPSRIYIPVACGQVKLAFIPAPGKANYTEAKVYHPIILLYFTHKTIQNWWPGILGMSHWGMFPTSVTICLQIREVHRNCNAPLHIYRKKQNRWKLHISFPRY
jgi:hypothetical protein